MNKRIRLLVAVLMVAAMAICFCACGGGGSQEETVEITTVAEEATQPTEADNISEYEKVYDEYNGQLKDAKDRDALDKVFEKGKKAMTDAMLASSEDDQDTYQKWFNKLNSVYTECAQDLTN